MTALACKPAGKVASVAFNYRIRPQREEASENQKKIISGKRLFKCMYGENIGAYLHSSMCR
jgi:hypothetical protein